MKKAISFLLVITLLLTGVSGCFVGTAASTILQIGEYQIDTSVNFTPEDDKEAQLWKYTGSDTVLDIPEYIGEYKITSVFYWVVQEKSNKKLHVEQINIPKTVIDMDETGHEPLSLCVDCTAICVDEENPVYSSENGILYSKDKTKLVRVPCAYPGEKLVIRDGVQVIGRGSLSDCHFTDIEFPNTLLSIEDKFMEHSQVQEFYFPDSLERISGLAFYYNYKTKFVHFGANTKIDSGFWLIQSVEEYSVSGNNPYLSVKDGVLFNKDKTSLIAYPPAKRADTYVVPDSVLKIGKYAFFHSDIKTLVANNVESVEANAFTIENTGQFKSVVFGENLKSIVIDGGLFGIVSWTFLSKDFLIKVSSLPTTKKTVYGYYGSSAYRLFYVDEAKRPYFDFVLLDEAPEQGFKYTDLTNDTIRIDSFTGFDTALEVPGYIDGKKVVEIGAYAFRGNTSITTLTLPSTLEQIDSHAFDDLTKVTTLTIPASVKKMDSYALSGMSALTKLYVNSFSCEIGENAFPSARVFACSGSTAESYAGNNNLSFVSVGHQFVSEEIENEKLKKTCTLCGYTEVVNNPNAQHSYVAEVIAPTCTQEGYTVFTCSVCGDTYTSEYKAALGHEPFEIKATAPTCQVEGKTAGVQCARCHLVLKEQEPIALLPHEYDGGKITTAPTCITKGVKTFTCRNCDASYTEEVPLIAHHYEKSVKEPTCTEGGYTIFTCSYCHDTYRGEETAMSAHVSQVIPAVAATCTSEGSTEGSRCAVCGLVLEAPHKTDKLPHQYDSGTLTMAPTCVKEGSKVYRCIHCDAVSTAVVKKIPHDYVAVVKPASCTETGYTTYTCAYCHNTYRDNLTPVLPHSPQVISAVAATCTSEGSTKGSKCASCGLILEAPQKIEKLPHQYNAGVVTKKATCQATGVLTYNCKNCTASYEKTIAKIGHIYRNVVKKAATFSQNGVVNNECSMCHALRKSTVIKALKSIRLTGTVFTYTGGKLATPKVIVKDSAGKTVAATQYTLTYISRANSKAVSSISAIGQYKVQVKFKKAYSGVKKLYFTVKPRAVVQYTPLTAKKAVSARWRKDASATGYQVVIAANKAFTAGKKTITLNKNGIAAQKFTGLKSGKIYYIKIRAYKRITVDGKSVNIYSSYSPVKAVKCK